MLTVADHNQIPQNCRRRFVRNGFRVMAAGLVFSLTDILLGCNQAQPVSTAGPLALPLAQIPHGGRVRLENNGAPVELVHTNEGIIARSLLCTHQGCRVRWFEAQQLYICPCHEGKFDARGEVVYGMPRAPLRLLKVTITADQVVVSG